MLLHINMTQYGDGVDEYICTKCGKNNNLGYCLKGLDFCEKCAYDIEENVGDGEPSKYDEYKKDHTEAFTWYDIQAKKIRIGMD